MSEDNKMVRSDPLKKIKRAAPLYILIMAVIAALESLKRPICIEITTDSQYVFNGMDKGWARRWSRPWSETASPRRRSPSRSGPVHIRCTDPCNPVCKAL